MFHTSIRGSKRNEEKNPFLGTWTTLRRISIVLNFHETLLKRFESFSSVQRKMFKSQLVLCFSDILWTMDCEMNDLMEEASKTWGDGKGDWFDPSLAHAFLLESISITSTSTQPEKGSVMENIELQQQSELSLRGKTNKTRSYYDTENSLCDRAFVKDWLLMRVDRYVKEQNDISELFKILFVHFRGLSNALRFWSSRCFMMNRIDLSTTIEMFESMNCVEEMSEVNAEDEEEQEEDETSTRHRRKTSVGGRRRRKAHPKCMYSD